MNLDTVKSNINRKIDKLMKDGLTLVDIKENLSKSKMYFKKMMDADIDANSIYSGRKALITMYVNLCSKRIDDITFATEKLAFIEFLAGVNDEDLYNLIKLRDKVSQDVIEMDFC